MYGVLLEVVRRLLDLRMPRDFLRGLLDLLVPLPAGLRSEDVARCHAGEEGSLVTHRCSRGGCVGVDNGDATPHRSDQATATGSDRTRAAEVDPPRTTART